MRYYIETYGCQMNAHDSEKLGGMLEELGHTPADNMANANLVLFNTCCVREHAETRVFGNVGALRERKAMDPQMLIGVCGCMMQQDDAAKKLMKKYPFVNFVFGTHSLPLLPEILSRALSGERVLSVRSEGEDIVEGLPMKRTRSLTASVNIMYGCDNYCSYCIVPYVRGRERSRESGHILTEVRALVAEGFTEIMLLGQNVNSYGRGTQTRFPELLRLVSDVEGLRRIRFMTSHPKDLSDELIEVMAERENICDHLHLPVQAGSDRILALMNRGYTREEYLRLIGKLRARNPRMEITTDIIVGFPGETEDDFSDTLSLIEEAGFSAAFTFAYSRRSGTRAAQMEDQLPVSVKKERLLRLNELQAIKTRETNARYLGTTAEVFIEGCDTRKDTPMLYGKLSSFKTVYFPGVPDKIGQYTLVSIQNTRENSLTGMELIPTP